MTRQFRNVSRRREPLYGWTGDVQEDLGRDQGWLRSRGNDPTVVGRLIAANYWPYSVCSAVIVLIVAVVPVLATRRFIPHLPKAPVRTEAFSILRIAADLWRTLQNRNFRSLFLTLLTLGMTIGIALSTLMHMYTYFWEFSSQQLSIVIAVQIPATVFAFFLLRPLGHRFDKHKLLQAAVLGLFANNIWFVSLRLLGIAPANHTSLLFAIALFQSVIQAMIALVYEVMVGSLMADVIDEHELNTGQRQEGLFFAAMGFGVKSIAALAASSPA